MREVGGVDRGGIDGNVGGGVGGVAGRRELEGCRVDGVGMDVRAVVVCAAVGCARRGVAGAGERVCCHRRVVGSVRGHVKDLVDVVACCLAIVVEVVLLLSSEVGRRGCFDGFLLCGDPGANVLGKRLARWHWVDLDLKAKPGVVGLVGEELFVPGQVNVLLEPAMTGVTTTGGRMFESAILLDASASWSAPVPTASHELVKAATLMRPPRRVPLASDLDVFARMRLARGPYDSSVGR